jgi:hypothetical protein
MAQQELNQRLERLKDAASEQTQSYESSRDKLYQNIVDAYIWWQDASKDSKYLTSLYKEAGIRTRTRGGNQPNFYPLVRLIWNIDISKRASTVSDWAQSMLAIHETAADGWAAKSRNLRDDLISHIRDLGGLSELRGEKPMTEDELFAEEDGEVIESKRGRKPGSTGNIEVIKTKTARAKTVSPKAKLKSFPSAIANNDDFVVMLARRNRSTNELEIVGTNYDDALVESALLACTDIDRASVTPSLRLIAEALQPHTVPAALEKYRKSFFDKSKLVERLQPDGTKEKVRETTTLLINGKSNEIVVTKTPLKATCVTRVKPKNITLHKGSELVLRGADRFWIERELLNNQKLALYTAEPTDKLVENNSETHTRYSLHLTSNTHKRSLYFYDAAEMPEESIKGFGFMETENLTTHWTIEATPQWLAKFDAECVRQWISAVKGMYNKPHNKKISLRVSNDALTLLWWWEEQDSLYQKSFSMPFNGDATATIQQDTQAELNPKDAMLLFSALSSLPLTNSVKLTAAGIGENLKLRLTVNYETELAKYHSELPNYELYEFVEDLKEDKRKEAKAAEKKLAKEAKKGS